MWLDTRAITCRRCAGSCTIDVMLVSLLEDLWELREGLLFGECESEWVDP
jgi:hypothetical protein